MDAPAAAVAAAEVPAVCAAPGPPDAWPCGTREARKAASCVLARAAAAAAGVPGFGRSTSSTAVITTAGLGRMKGAPVLEKSPSDESAAKFIVEAELLLPAVAAAAEAKAFS